MATKALRSFFGGFLAVFAFGLCLTLKNVLLGLWASSRPFLATLPGASWHSTHGLRPCLVVCSGLRLVNPASRPKCRQSALFRSAPYCFARCLPAMVATSGDSGLSYRRTHAWWFRGLVSTTATGA